MKKEHFTATILDGHKGPGFQLPFDPAQRWHIPAVQLRPGRRGHHVRGTLNGIPFESIAVARARKVFVLVGDVLQTAVGVVIGQDVKVRIGPRDVPEVKSNRGAGTKRSRSKTDPLARIRRICLALLETSEKEAWGAPTFRVRGKIFVTFMNNHHGDGRVAICCNAPPGAQQGLVASDPEHLFVPPYVGGRGWLDVRLDKGLDWSIIAELIKEAYRATAPGHYSLP